MSVGAATLLVPPGATARLSEDGVYRYELTRRWGGGPMATWIMLNPSTADATLDDQTIRRCRGFSKTWGMGGLLVVNLFALRATDPRALRTAADPVGPENDDAIHDAVVRSRVVIAAWGTHGGLLDRERHVIDLLEQVGREPLVLGLTKNGHPRHPLRVPALTRPRRSWQLSAERGA